MQEIEKYVPDFWTSDDISDVRSHYINDLFRTKGYRVTRLRAIQDRHRYGLFKVRQQFLANYPNNKTYYAVQMFVSVPKDLEDLALEYHLDSRRCDYDFQFMTTIEDSLYDSDHVIFIVRVITFKPKALEWSPEKDTDFIIEYLADFY